MPGWKVEFGEDIDEAVAREVKEETNLKVKVIRPYDVFSYVSDDGNRHTVDIQYIVEIIEDIGNLKIADAHDEAKWAGREEIDGLEISESMKEGIRKGYNFKYNEKRSS